MSNFEVERRKRPLYLCLDLKPPYVAKVATKSYLVGYITPQSQTSDEKRGNTKEHVVCFLDCIRSPTKDADPYMRESSKYLADQAYI